MIERVVELYVAEFEPQTPDAIFRRQTPDAMPELDPRALASMAKFDLDDFEERHCEVCRLHTAFYVFDKCACCQQEVCEDCLVPFMYSSAQQSMCSRCRWMCSMLLQVLFGWYGVWRPRES